MDEELKQLAALALRNAFWRDFSGLVNKYLEASEGLDIDKQELMMGDLTSVYGRDTTKPFDGFQGIYSTGPTYRDCEHDSIVGALEYAEAHAVFVQGLKVFERRDGEWHFVGDQ